LLAINGLRVLPQSIGDQINSLQPDEQVELTLARNGQLLTLPVRVQLGIPEKFEIVTKPKMSRQEKLRLEKWLGMNLQFGK
jgi:predicted metalloprotease with PDZ domain